MVSKASPKPHLKGSPAVVPGLAWAYLLIVTQREATLTACMR